MAHAQHDEDVATKAERAALELESLAAMIRAGQIRQAVLTYGVDVGLRSHISTASVRRAASACVEPR